MEKYALRAILSCRGFKRTHLQNLAFLLEEEAQEIADNYFLAKHLSPITIFRKKSDKPMISKECNKRFVLEGIICQSRSSLLVVGIAF